MLRLYLLLCSVGILYAAKVRYDDHKVVRVIPSTQKEFTDIQRYQQFLIRERVDIWRRSHGPNSPLDFRISPDKTYILRRLTLKYSVLIPDVEALNQYVEKSNELLEPRDGGFAYNMYHKLSDIMDWMNSMASTYSGKVEVFPIATSYEGRSLNGLKISVNSQPGRPGIWLQGGIHGREWVSPATVIYMTNQLLSQYGVDPDVTAALDSFDVYVVPVVNVDGYAYTWTTDRMWRKTRSKTSISGCEGVDPNRNWDFHWCEQPGASTNPCLDSYCGPSAFSENVVRGVANYIKMNTNMIGFIDFHGYSQQWMTPWGYTKMLPKDVAQQNASSAVAVEALTSVHGTKFSFGTIANTIYLATGSSADWTYGVANVKYSVAVELRDTGKFGFLLPPDQIIPSGEETIRGVLAWMDFIKNNM